MKKYFKTEKTAEIGPDGFDDSGFGYHSYYKNVGNRTPCQWRKMLMKRSILTEDERVSRLKFKSAINELRKLLT